MNRFFAMQTRRVSISHLRFFSLIGIHEPILCHANTARFNLTLEILFTDRHQRMFNQIRCKLVSISHLRFFSLIALSRTSLQTQMSRFNLTLEILFTDRSFVAVGFGSPEIRVSISHLRFFSLIGKRGWGLSYQSIWFQSHT